MPNNLLTAALKWPGGQSYTAEWIVSLMPPHLHFVEAYCGGAAVLFARDPNRDWWAVDGRKLAAGEKGCSEVINDIDSELTNFFSVIQNPALFELFERMAVLTQFSRVEFSDACEPLDENSNYETYGGVNAVRAVRFFIRNRQSLMGMGKGFAPITRNRTRGRINEQVNAWLGGVEGLPQIALRLLDVLVLNEPARDVIRKHDGKKTLFYLDPPFPHETRKSKSLYRFEMSEEDHILLLEDLTNIEGAFLLSSYANPLYDTYAERNGWVRHDKQIDSKMGKAAKKESRIAAVYANFN